MTKILNKRFLTLTAMLLSGCSYFTTTHTQHIVKPLVKNPTSVVVCREKQCAPARLSMSREYIYNSLLQLLQNNKGSKALICTAESASHTCVEEYLDMPITVGVTPAHMYIDDVKITDVKVSKGKPKIDVVLHYDVTYNGQTPSCKPAQTAVFVESADSIMMQDNGYTCKMTTIGISNIKTVFAIDYIDLDYGYIGGYYSIGVSGPANGGGAGYMMIRLPVDAYPLSPALTDFEDKEKSKEETKELPQENSAQQQNPVQQQPNSTQQPNMPQPAMTPQYAPQQGIPAQQPYAPQQIPAQQLYAPQPAMVPTSQQEISMPQPYAPQPQLPTTVNYVQPDPAMLPEVMVQGYPTDMTFSGPQVINGTPVTKIVVEDAAEVKSNKGKHTLQVFPIYSKKSAGTKDKAVSAGDNLKDAIKEETKETPKEEPKEEPKEGTNTAK